MSLNPSVKWAQRSDVLFITVELPDSQDVNLKLEPEGKLLFSAARGVDKTRYELELDLFDKVDVNESKSIVGLRNICYLVKKAENKWWDRLIKQTGKPPEFLKIDWDKWIDEDEEPENEAGADMDFGEIDFSKLNTSGNEEFDDFDGDDADEDGEDSETEDVNKEAAVVNSGESDQKLKASTGEDEAKA